MTNKIKYLHVLKKYMYIIINTFVTCQLTEENTNDLVLGSFCFIFSNIPVTAAILVE